MKSRKLVLETRESYKKDEKELKELRLSIEETKVKTIHHMDAMNIKSPMQWRDNLIQFRIRRKVLNRENSLTFKQKEEIYNNSSLSREDLESLERASPLKIEFKNDKSAPKNFKCIQKKTIDVLTS
jgi:hypothetical protein